VQYQLVLASGRSFNGPAGQRWRYDGGGDFWAERELAGDGTLELSLAELAPAGLTAALELHGEHVVRSREDEARALLDDAAIALREQLGAEQDRAAACAVVRSVAADARNEIDALMDEALRPHAALAWATLFGQFAAEQRECLTAADLSWVFERVPAEHVAWSFLGMQVDLVFGAVLDDPALGEFRRRLQTVQTEPGLRAHLLFLDLVQADRREDQTATRTLYAELARDYADTHSALWARERYDPERPLQVGRAMPDWSFAGLDGEPVRSADLRGRAYLLDVWATWCGPCVGEMQHLHAAWEALGGAGGPIAFVSVSIDAQVATVEAFRREKWPMPWTNLHEPNEHALFEAWQFSGVPMVVLVDADGRIAATEAKLRGDDLLGSLQALAGQPSSRAHTSSTAAASASVEIGR
jgi:thiol-disulfide isomerase/thioredoxin